MKVWLYTDSHFFHDKMVEFCGRPVDHTERQVANWKRLVAPEDLVFHLGDVALGVGGRMRELQALLQGLPCKKVLILGNHDKQSPTWYMRNGFDAAVTSIVYKRVFLTHKPADRLPPGAWLNVHGHLHNSPHHKWEHIEKPWHRLLHIEDRLEPVEFDKFVNADLSREQIRRDMVKRLNYV
jgi:calcineurin-like phosphoesterase family protein